MTSITVFQTEIYRSHLEISASALLVEIERLRASDPGVSRSNVGGYHSAPLRPSASQPALQRLEGLASQEIRQIANDLGLGPLRMTGLWANISGPGDRNDWHIHPFTCLSAVFYVQAPEGSGRLILERPDPQAHFWRRFSEEDPRSRSRIAIDPQAGDLIVFPAYLRHQVEENRSADLRISCAMNFAY
jgi:uncharacterized protein (TIGR02466 family)